MGIAVILQLYEDNGIYILTSGLGLGLLMIGLALWFLKRKTRSDSQTQLHHNSGSKSEKMIFGESRLWHAKRYEMIVMSGNICSKCSARDKQIEVYHVKSILEDWSSRLKNSNLAVFCSHCAIEEGVFYNSIAWRKLKKAKISAEKKVSDTICCKDCGIKVFEGGNLEVEHVEVQANNPRQDIEIRSLRLVCKACKSKHERNQLSISTAI